MMAMRLPTGLLEGRALSESAWMTRMLSGARCKISATTVDTKVSCAWPEVEVAINAVTVPPKSTRTRHESIQVVVWFLGLKSGSNDELPPEGSKQVEMPMPANMPWARRRSRSCTMWAMGAALRALSITVA